MMRNPTLFERVIQIISSPYFAIVWFGLIVISYFFVDPYVALGIHDALSPQIIRIVDILTDLGKGKYYIIGLLPLFLLARFVLRNANLASKIFYLWSSVTLAGVICLLFKTVLGRARPVEFFSNDLFGFYFFQVDASMLSFPSGHATTITALMVALSFLLPRYWIACFTTLLVISFSRVILNAHYLSDIMAGMYLGAMTAILLSAAFAKQINQYRSSQHVESI